ncbi:phosphotransferase [bacterium]|nr:phosphotransferase [Bacteroides sp.]MBD5401333.1 phosphotransferase [bacterium]
MKTPDLDISDFDDREFTDALKVDFGRATRLVHSGSTCDAYDSMIQRRRVFIKRLKPEFRDNPLYRSAFDKEYDLGVGLNHVSLPRYVTIGDDYLVMDFIEGDTLGELLRRGDERLQDKRFVDRLLGELIDVIEYLHRHQVVHCDIKPDNLIVSPYDGQPLTLVDFDKAYTSWLSDTAGNPAKYDCETCSDGQVDFKGICAIADLLGHKGLAAMKDNKELTIAALRRALATPSRHRYIVAAIVLGLIICCGALAYNLRQPSMVSALGDEIVTEEVVEAAEPVNTDEASVEPSRVEPVVVEKTIVVNNTHPDTCNTTKVDYLIENKLDEVTEIIHQVIDPYIREGNELIAKASDTTIPLSQIEEADEAYRDKFAEIIGKTDKELQKRYDFYYQQEGGMLFMKSGLFEPFYSGFFQYTNEIGRVIQERKGIK